MPPDLDLVLHALANPTRWAILGQLMAGEASVNCHAAPFSLSQPTISTHLKILESAGLVTRGRQGNQRPVGQQAAALASFDSWIGPFRALWDQRLDQLEAVARHLQHKDEGDEHDVD